MKNKKYIFNVKLYIEGLRQLKTIGIISSVICLILGIIMPTGFWLSAKSNYQEYLLQDSLELFSKTQLSVTECHIYYALFFLVFTPLMVLSLFKFLTRREDSDFYHSIPHTRKCLFFSFSGALLTWLAAEILLTSVVSAVLYGAFSKYLVIDIGQIFFFALNILIICMLIFAGMILAYSLSGNLITTMIVFLMIFFIPRIFITFYHNVLMETIPYLTQDTNLFAARYNLFYAFFMENAHSYYEEYFMTSLHFASLYTIILALILYIISCIAFSGRKSETAENSMNSRMMQGIFRTIFTMTVCMIPISIIFIYHAKKNTIYYDNRTDLYMFVFYVIIAYIGAIVGMFLYELLTTKNIRNALKSLKTLPAIAVLNAAFIFLLFSSFHHYLDMRMDAADVSSVSVSADNDYPVYYAEDRYYFDHILQTKEFKDEELISLLCSAFNSYADKYTSYLNGESENFYDHEDNMSYYKVKFNGKSGKTFRIGLNSQDSEALYQIVEKNEVWEQTYTKFPELTEKDTISIGYSTLPNNINLSENELKKLYASLKNEADQIPFAEWMQILNDDDSNELTLNIHKYMDGDYYLLSLPVSKTTPKTYSLLLRLYEKKHKKDVEDFHALMTDFKTLAEETNSNQEISLNFTALQSDGEWEEFHMSSSESGLEKKLSLIQDHIKPVTENLSDEEIVLYVYVQNNDYASQKYQEKTFIFSIPEEIMEEF